MLNRCEFIGNLGRDPEVRMTQDGSKVVNLSLGVTERWKSASGEKQERTEWVKITIWNEKLGEVAERYCRKGSRIYIAGQLQTRKWQKDGVDQYTTEVVLQRFRGELTLLDSAPAGGTRQDSRGPVDAYAPLTPPAATRGGDDLNDEIPY